VRSLFQLPRRAQPQRATEATVEQLIGSGALAGMSTGYDPLGEPGPWRRVGQMNREIPWWTHEKARANSVAAYRVNAMAKAIIDTYTSFCVGDVGVSYQCTNPDVKEIVDEFWNDPRNNMGGIQELLFRDGMIMGETCLRLIEFGGGRVRFAPVAVSAIQDVTMIMGNTMWPDTLIFDNNISPNLSVVRINDETGLREGEAFFWAPYKTLTTDIRSMPFLAPIIDWLDSYDTVMSNMIDRTALARYLVWDVTVTGGQDAVDQFIAARGGTSIPRSGTIEVHNESVVWEPKTVSTGAQEDSVAGQSIMTLIAGGAGLSKTWLAEPEGANRATSLSMAEPVRRRVQGVQRQWLGQMQELVRFVVDRAVANGKIPAEVTSVDEKTGQEKKIPASQSVTVTGPEVAAADSQITAQVLLNLSTGLQNLVGTGSLSAKAGEVAARKAWEDYVGIPYTADLDDPNDPANERQGKALDAAAAPPPPPMIAGQPAGSNGTNVPGTNTGKGKNVQTAPPVAAKTPAS
jgi:hypothetical protein